MTSSVHTRVKSATTRLVRDAHRQFRHVFVRALILALLLQLFPFQPLGIDVGREGQQANQPILGLTDITRLLRPSVAYATVTALTKTSVSEIDQGEDIYYTLVMTNTGTDITVPRIIDVIDITHLEFVATATGSPGWAASNTPRSVNPVTVTFFPLSGIMAADTTVVMEISLKARAPLTDGTVITNDLYYATWEGGTFNNVETVTTRVNAPAFSMSSKASAEPVCAGELITYTVYVTNSGHLATSREFTLTVDLDSGVEFAAAGSPLPVHNDGTLTWGNIDTILNPGEAIQRTFWVTVSPEMEQDNVLAHLARAASPQDVMPDGTLAITSTVNRVAANFSADSPVCTGDVITFTRLYADVPVTSGHWDWGDGSYTDSPASEITHTYSSGGIYTVTHTVTGTCGVTQTHAYTSDVFVDGVSTSFAPPTTVSVCLGSSVSFTATDAVSSSIVGRSWDFGDGHVITTASQIVTTTHTYTRTGRYTVTLTVTNEAGCSYTLTRPDAVLVDGVIADFEPAATITACLNSSTTFTDTSLADSAIITREWDFGDGTVLKTADMTATHTYVNGGYYTVTLRVTNTTGCSGWISRSHAVFVDSARADFVATPPTTCVNSGVTFSSTSVTSSTIEGYEWDFGDGGIASSPTLSQVTHIYTTTGYYTVTLTITTHGGCSFSEVKPDYIFVDGLTPRFEPTTTVAVCSGDATVHFTDTSAVSSTVAAHLWDWGDGTVSATESALTATHTYTAAGYYTVTMTVTSANGCAETVVHPNQVFVNRAEAIISEPTPPLGICLDEGGEVTFTSGSVTSDTIQGITEHRWDFGDGTIVRTGSVTTATHAYASTGSFTVTLAITSGNCTDEVVSPNHVLVDNIVPSFEPTQKVTICRGATVYFTDTSDFDTAILSRVWDFGDGTQSPNLSTTIYASHTYMVAGSYAVRLTLSSVGCTDKYTEAMGLIFVEEVTAAFDNPSASCTGVPVPFTYTGAYSGALASLVWDFGDGTIVDTGTTTATAHSYAAPGAYTVILTVTTSAGCQDVTTGAVFIEGADVSFDPPAPQRVCVDAPVTFSDTSAVSGTIVTYLWDFGDGETSTLAVAQHAYEATGSYTVSLTLETAAGCRATVTRTNWIMVESVTAAISPAPPILACIDQPVAFSDASTSVPPGSITSRLWDFGDGTTSSEQAPVHAFSSGGDFTVRLTVTTTGGCVGTDSVVVNVQGASVGFDAPTAVCYRAGGADVTFVNTTEVIGGLDYYEWRFGDGDTNTTDWDQVTHVYAAPGTYEATLFVSTTAGCMYTHTQPIAVEVLTASMAHTPPDTVCAGTDVVFVDTSDVDGTIVSRLWDFGDGTSYDSGTTAETSHAYTEGGTYDIRLTVTTEGGCTDWVTSTIYVDDITAAFVVETPLPACLGTTVHFSDTSSATSGIAAVEWDFGDGSTSTDRVVDHRYTSAGTYVVWLRATNGNGCQRDISTTVSIEDVTAAIDLPDGTTVCQYDPTTFNDASTVVGTISSWLWEFSDGQTADTASVTRPFDVTGTHVVTLTVTTSAGCADTTSVSIDVEAYPMPNIEVTPEQPVTNKPTSFVDTGTGGYRWEWDFGDGSTAGPLSNPSVSHTYANPGTFTVILTVTSRSGCASVTQKELQIVDVPPVGDARIAADPEEIFAGESAEVCVWVTDTLGSPITDGTSVQLYQYPIMGVLADSVLTTTNGTACTTFTAYAPMTDTVTIVMSVDGLTRQTEIVIHPEFYVELALERSNIEIEESIRLTVTVRDRNEQPVPDGTAVTLTQSPVLGYFAGGAPGVVLLTSGGVATTTYTGLIAGATSLTADVEGYKDPETLLIALKAVYLPIALRNYGSDLEALSIQVMFGATDQDPDYVQIIIRNNGPAPVSGFWVDLYLDPRREPEVGVIWPTLCKFGKAWYVREALPANGVLTLDTRTPDDPTAPGKRYSIWPKKLPTGKHRLYAQVDSYWKPYGLVFELNEDNNVLGPKTYNVESAAYAPEPTPHPAPNPQEANATPQPAASTPPARPTLPGATATPTPGP